MYKIIFVTSFFIFCLSFVSCSEAARTQPQTSSDTTKIPDNKSTVATTDSFVFDTAMYDRYLQHISNGDSSGKWPVKKAYSKQGAIFPFNRVVAYYGNLYSKNMGILGELRKDSMLKKLQSEVEKWRKADTVLKVIPALHYIAVTAQLSPGAGNTYRLRMPFHQIDTIVKWANEIKGLVFIDVQVGLSTLQKELPEFEKYLKMPNVHFAIDPEFSMKTGKKPGTVVGTFDAADINYVINYLATIAEKNNLPPKILIVHRFTQPMVTNYQNIKLNPNVQVVMDMDGWGTAPRKINTYKQFIYPQPVQFTGFKIFYKNDTKKVGQPKEMQPAQVLKLTPHPVYIQYQ